MRHAKSPKISDRQIYDSLLGYGGPISLKPEAFTQIVVLARKNGWTDACPLGCGVALLDHVDEACRDLLHNDRLKALEKFFGIRPS